MLTGLNLNRTVQKADQENIYEIQKNPKNMSLKYRKKPQDENQSITQRQKNAKHLDSLPPPPPSEFIRPPHTSHDRVYYAGAMTCAVLTE